VSVNAVGVAQVQGRNVDGGGDGGTVAVVVVVVSGVKADQVCAVSSRRRRARVVERRIGLKLFQDLAERNRVVVIVVVVVEIEAVKVCIVVFVVLDVFLVLFVLSVLTAGRRSQEAFRIESAIFSLPETVSDRIGFV